MLIDSIAPETEAARQAAETGTDIPREYHPGTTLRDREGREWLVTSYRTRIYPAGTAPFEAWEISRAWKQCGPFTVVDAAGHTLVHPAPLPGCHNCPPAPCRCGNATCTNFAAHGAVWASAETTIREAA